MQRKRGTFLHFFLLQTKIDRKERTFLFQEECQVIIRMAGGIWNAITNISNLSEKIMRS